MASKFVTEPPTSKADSREASRRGFLLLDILPELCIVAIVVCGLAIVLASVFSRHPLASAYAPATGETPSRSELPDSIYEMALQSDGGLAIATFESSLVRLNPDGGEEWRVPRFSPDQAIVALSEKSFVRGLGDGRVTVCTTLEEAAEAHTLGQHSDAIWSVVVSRNGSFAASSDLSGAMKVWDLENRVELTALRTPASKLGCRVIMAFSEDGSQFAVADACHMEVRKIPSGETIADLTQPMPAIPHVIRISPDGRFLAEGDDRGWVSVWDLTSKSLVWTDREIGYPVLSLEFTRESRTLLVGSLRGEVCIFDATDGLRQAEFTAHESGVRSLLTTADGRIYTGGYDGHLHRWNLETLLSEATLR